MAGFNRKGKRVYQRKKLPNARKNIDVAQNKKIENLEKKVKKLQYEPELKYNDESLTVTNIPTTGSLGLFNGISIDSDQEDGRIGAEIRMTSLQFRMYLQSDPASLFPTITRMIVFIDKFANGANPTIAADPLAGTNPALLNTADVAEPYLAPYQYENIDRFHILEDKTFTITPQVVQTTTTGTTTAVLPVAKMINRYYKLNKKVKYGDNTNLIGSINSNSLFILLISNIAGADALIGSRVYYKDS